MKIEIPNYKSKPRSKTNKLLFAALAVFVSTLSCSPRPAVVERTKNSVENLALGKTIFVNSCGKCHDLPSPADHSAPDWVGILNAMAPRAKLNDEQHRIVYNYIVWVKK